MQLVKINGIEGVMFEFDKDIGRKIGGVQEFLKVAPEGIKGRFPHAYMLRHYELDWDKPCTIEEYVLVNRLGFILLEKPVTFQDPGDKYVNVKSFERLEE